MNANEEVRTFQRLMETTTWISVAPHGKAYAIEFLARLQKTVPEGLWNELVDITSKSMNLEFTEVVRLTGCTAQELVDVFSKTPEYNRDWIQTYLDYTANHEAPEQFHFWTACSILSASTNRRVWFDQNYYRVFPNLYVILVAPAGRCRRSVATNIGIKMLRKSEIITVLSEKITPEGLAMALHSVGEKGGEGAPSSLMIHAPELSVFLGRQQYNEGLIALLTTLYDCPDIWEYVTRTKSEIKLKNVFLACLGATAPDWLADSIPPVAFGGGYLSRTMVIAASETPRVFPFPVPTDPSLEVQLIKRLQAMTSRTGNFRFTDQAKRWYEKWYDNARKIPLENSFVSGYFERKQDHLIRVATLLTLAHENMELEYTVDIMEEALAALEATEPNLPLAFKHIGITNEGRTQDQILWFIRRQGGKVSHVKLIQGFVGRLSARQISDTLEILKAGAMLIEKGRKHGEEHGYELTDVGWTGPSLSRGVERDSPKAGGEGLEGLFDDALSWPDEDVESTDSEGVS